MRKILGYLLWLFYPKRCAVCGKVIDRDKHLCKDCGCDIETIENSCSVCGGIKDNCECRWHVYRFNGCVAPFYKGENTMRMIYRFKLHGKLDTAQFLAEEIYSKISEYYKEQKFDIITAVPTTKFKRITKGYNHSEVIAKHLAKLMGTEYKNLLNKRPFYKPQHTLNRDERYKNVKDMFYAKCNHNFKKILLVDDVKTTGATLNECTKELLFSGGEEVYCSVAVSNVLAIEK